jgi:hypothetical protein
MPFYAKAIFSYLPYLKPLLSFCEPDYLYKLFLFLFLFFSDLNCLGT